MKVDSVAQQREQHHTALPKQGPNFPLTSSGHALKNNDRRRSQDVASEYILKEIYFTPQNEKKGGRELGIWVHRECIDNCSLHFFGVSSEKNVNTVIIIALHKSRLMPVFPPRHKALSLSSD